MKSEEIADENSLSAYFFKNGEILNEIQGNGGEEDQCERQWGKEVALPRCTCLYLLRGEALEVFLDSDRQLLAREGSVEVLFGAKDSGFFAG